MIVVMAEKGAVEFALLPHYHESVGYANSTVFRGRRFHSTACRGRLHYPWARTNPTSFRWPTPVLHKAEARAGLTEEILQRLWERRNGASVEANSCETSFL